MHRTLKLFSTQWAKSKAIKINMIASLYFRSSDFFVRIHSRRNFSEFLASWFFMRLPFFAVAIWNETLLSLYKQWTQDALVSLDFLHAFLLSFSFSFF